MNPMTFGSNFGADTRPLTKKAAIWQPFLLPVGQEYGRKGKAENSQPP